MGFFSKKPDYPELGTDNPAAGQLSDVQEPLETLISQISDPLEVVTADEQTCVFIGKPPKKFGVATIEDGEVQSFVAAAKEKGLDQVRIQKLNERFRDAYVDNQDAQRYRASIGGREIVVTPCAELAREVSQIMSSM
jgi:hypothetical protein